MGAQQLTGVASKSLRKFLQFEPTTPEDLAAMSEDHLFMIVILKSIEQKGMNSMPVYNTKKKMKGSNGFGAKAATSYFRMHLCQNLLSDQGETFYIIERDNTFVKLWGKGNACQLCCLYGHPFIMALGHNDVTYMSNNTLVVIPQYSLSELRLKAVDYPETPMGWQTESVIGDTWAFCIHGIQIGLYGVSLCGSICSGRYCDRRLPDEGVKSCPCYTANQDRDCQKLTLQVHVRVFQEEFPNKVGYEIDTSFTSYTFLKWCLLGGKIPVDMELNDKFTTHHLKTALNKMVKFINDHGGFTLIGWTTCGEQVDHNNSEEKIQSDHLTIHIAHIVST
jgi:hypothetical protein